MAPSSVSPLSSEMRPGLGKPGVQPRLKGGLVGVVVTTAPSRMGTTGHGTVPATRTLMGTPSGGTPPLGCVRVCMWGGGGGRGICQYWRGTGWEERGEFSFWFLVKNVKEREGSHG